MTVLEKTVHSDAYTVNIYKEGVFWIAYEQSAYYFWQKKRYKLTKKFIKLIRQEVVSCGFPQNALDLLVCENEKDFTLTTDSSHLKTFRIETPIDPDAFEEWKTGFPVSFDGSGQRKAGKDNQCLLEVFLFLPAAGNRNNTGSFPNVGSNGNYWSSTTASSGAFHLNFNSSRVSPEINNNRVNGFSVRCVAELNTNSFLFLKWNS